MTYEKSMKVGAGPEFPQSKASKEEPWLVPLFTAAVLPVVVITVLAGIAAFFWWEITCDDAKRVEQHELHGYINPPFYKIGSKMYVGQLAVTVVDIVDQGHRNCYNSKPSYRYRCTTEKAGNVDVPQSELAWKPSWE